MKSLALLVCVATTAHGQATSASAIPVRSLAPASGATTAPLRSILGNVRQLPGGRLLVNDYTGRRLYLFDSTLRTPAVLLDSAAGLPNSYGSRVRYLLPYLADSSLLVDAASSSLTMIDPAGGFGRALALPNTRDLAYLTNLNVSVDGAGRLIYEGRLPGPPFQPREQPRVTQGADTAPILRADFDRRTVDTLGYLKISAPNRTEIVSPTHRRMTVNPIRNVDGWTVTSMGSVALIRGIDYHVDWIHSDGARSSAPKMPFAWRRLTDVDKQKVIDSVIAQQKAQDSLRAARGGAASTIRVENGRDVVVTEGNNRTEVTFVPLDQMVDYWPPINSGAVRADLDGNIWILPATTLESKTGERVYDVINGKGELFERVRLPDGRAIAGFGKGGVVYLSWQEPEKGWFIERRKVVR